MLVVFMQFDIYLLKKEVFLGNYKVIDGNLFQVNFYKYIIGNCEYIFIICLVFFNIGLNCMKSNLL